MALLGTPGYSRPPDTVWNHYVIWGDVTNRWFPRQSYGMAERRCPKSLRVRRAFYPFFSMRLWWHEHRDQSFRFRPRSKWGTLMSGSDIVRRRRHRQNHGAKNVPLIKIRYHGARPVVLAKPRKRYR